MGVLLRHYLTVLDVVERTDVLYFNDFSCNGSDISRTYAWRTLLSDFYTNCLSMLP